MFIDVSSYNTRCNYVGNILINIMSSKTYTYYWNPKLSRGGNVFDSWLGIPVFNYPRFVLIRFLSRSWIVAVRAPGGHE